MDANSSFLPVLISVPVAGVCYCEVEHDHVCLRTAAGPAPFKLVIGTIAIQEQSLRAILIPMLSRVQVLWRPLRRKTAALCSGSREGTAAGSFNRGCFSTGEGSLF